MKMRLSVKDGAELVRRDGTVVGSIVGITVDLDLGALGVGGEVVVESSEGEELQPPTPADGQTALLPNPLTQVWLHYQATVAGADRRKLDSTRTTCIRRALKVRTVDECCEAINALAASDWHNGQNPGRGKYLDIQYALGMKSESADERIDKMAAKAPGSDNGPTTVQRLLSRLPSETHGMVRGWIADVEAMLRNPDHKGLSSTGQGALGDLRTKALMEPVVANGRIIDWKDLKR